MHSVETAPRRLSRHARRTADQSYENFRLVIGNKGERSAGIAYAGKVPAFHAEAATTQDVADQLRSQIDEDLDRRRAKGAPSWQADDFALALELISHRLSPIQTHVLSRIAEAGRKPMDIASMVWPSGFAPDAVRRAFNRTVKMVFQALDPESTKGSKAGEAFDAHVRSTEDGGPWTFSDAFREAAARFSGGAR